MSDMLQIIAPGQTEHAEALFAMLNLIWPGSSEHNRSGRINHSHYDWGTSRIGVLGERVVTHYGVYDLTQRIGTARVRTAGVNLVATHPDYRRRGLMAQTTWASIAAMRSQGYDISVLCNAIPNYYHRFGYVFAWPESDYTLKTANFPSGLPDFAVEEFDSCEPGEPLMTAMADLYNRQNETVTGTAVRPTYRRGKVPGDNQGYCWLDIEGHLKGYILGGPGPKHNTFWHEDSAGDPAEILQVLAMLARQEGLEAVRFHRLPPKNVVGVTLKRLNCRLEAKYWRNGGFMLLIVNLHSLFEKLSPELSRRLRHSRLAAWQGHLRIHYGQESVTLSLAQGQVQVVPAVKTPHMIQGGPEIAQLVIGTGDPAEIVEGGRIKLSGDTAALVDVLFPEQYPQLTNCDL